MKNNQKPRKQKLCSGSSLDAVEIFAFLQGDGPLLGVPAIFIRLRGCNLACPLCDTNYSRGGLLHGSEIIGRVVYALGLLVFAPTAQDSKYPLRF